MYLHLHLSPTILTIHQPYSLHPTYPTFFPTLCPGESEKGIQGRMTFSFLDTPFCNNVHVVGDVDPDCPRHRKSMMGNEVGVKWFRRGCEVGVWWTWSNDSLQTAILNVILVAWRLDGQVIRKKQISMQHYMEWFKRWEILCEVH